MWVFYGLLRLLRLQVQHNQWFHFKLQTRSRLKHVNTFDPFQPGSFRLRQDSGNGPCIFSIVQTWLRP